MCGRCENSFSKSDMPPRKYNKKNYGFFIVINNHTIGSEQKSLRLHDLQCLPIHTSSNCFIACSTISGSSVRMPMFLIILKPIPNSHTEACVTIAMRACSSIFSVFFCNTMVVFPTPGSPITM